MEITFVADRFSREPGGAQKVVTELADRLSDEHDVVLAVPDRTPRGPTDGSASTPDEPRRVIRYRQGFGSRVLAAPADYVALPLLRRYAHRRFGLPAARLFGVVAGQSLALALPHRPDVVHAFSADMTAHLALGLGRAVGAPVVCTGFPHPGQYGDGPIDRAAYRRADAVVALSGHDREVYLGLGVARERIWVIPPPSDDLGTEGRERARERLGIAGRLAVFAGARRPYKGADVLHAAAPAIGARVEGVTIAFVGPGDPLPPLPGVRIRDAGEVEPATVGDWIRAADALVLPSLHEILPIVVLEAWSAGVPVVVSNIPALRHLIEESGGGIAVPREADAVAAAIIELLEDESRRRSLGESGRAYWRTHCAVDEVVRAHAELYAQLAAHDDSGKARQR